MAVRDEEPGCVDVHGYVDSDEEEEGCEEEQDVLVGEEGEQGLVAGLSGDSFFLYGHFPQPEGGCQRDGFVGVDHHDHGLGGGRHELWYLRRPELCLGQQHPLFRSDSPGAASEKKDAQVHNLYRVHYPALWGGGF